MSLNKEHSREKAEWVKWPHLETHWQPQHYESPHRTINKKADNSRSHSWWWDSHISPKSSKWLQDNLAEMDSKVNAMLRIIEEDADSFAKRAEMYYKRRPELVSLVEEFYRTYRALVERHTFLTKELRQNIAPVLQAQLGASFESPLISPSDLLVKHGSDGFDLASISSYSFPGALEFDDDSQSEFSAKSSKGRLDEEDASSRNSRVSFETREFEFKPWVSSAEEEHLPSHPRNKDSHGPVDAGSYNELRKTIQHLEDENKSLTVKSGENDVKLKDLQSEVSGLLSKTKALETEDRMARERLKSLLQLKQELEAENLKLSHALISSKEEKTQLIEVRDRGLQEILASGKRIRQLEEEVAQLEHKTAAAHADMLVGQEQAKKFEVECEKLRHTLAAAQDENQMDAATLKETFERQFEGLQKRVVGLEEENEGLKEQSAAQTVKLHEFELQVMEVDGVHNQLEQDLLNARKLKEALELESSKMELKIEELQRELEEIGRNKEELSEQIMQRDRQVSKFEEAFGDVCSHRKSLEAEKDDMLKHVVGLEADFKELQKERDCLVVESQDCKSQCKALEIAEAQLKERLASLLNKNNCLQEDKVTLEDMLAKAHLEVKELQCNLSALTSEKSLLLQKASGKADVRQIKKEELLQESVMQTIHFRDLEVALVRLLEEKDMLKKRKAEALQAFCDLEKMSQAECAKSKQMVDEHLARIAELEIRLATLIEERDLLERQGRESSSKLKEELGLLKTERVEGSKLVERLRVDVEELKKTKDHSFAKCQQFEAECKALKAAEEGLQVQYVAKLADGVSLRNEKTALEAELAKLRPELESQLTRSAELVGVVSSVLHEKNVLEGKEVEAKKALLWLEKEKNQLIEDLEGEKKRLSFDLQQAGQQVVELQEVITSLSTKYTKSQADYCIAEEGARTAQVDIERQLSQIQMLQNEIHAKQELIFKLENEVTSKSIGLTKLEESLLLMGNEKEKNIKTMGEYEVKIHDLEMRVAELLALQTALSGQVAQKSQDVKSLEAELVKVCKEKETLMDEFSVMSGHVMLLQKQLENCKEVEDAQRVDLQKRTDRIQTMELEAETLQLSVSEAVERNNALIFDQQKSLDEISCMRRRIEGLEEQVSHLTEDKELLVKDNEVQKGKWQVQLQNSDDMNRSLEAELLKLHKAVSTVEEGNSVLVCEQGRSLDASLHMSDRIQSRSLDASLSMSDRIKHLHHKVGGLIEERAFLVSEVSSHNEQRNEMELRLQSLERDKDAVHKELLHALASGQQLRGDMQNLHGEKEQLAAALGVEVLKVENLEREWKKLQETLNTSHEENVALIGQLTSSTEEGESLRNDLRAMQEELKRSQMVVSEAKRNIEKLEGDITGLMQANVVVEKELNTKITELQEDASKVVTRKDLLEVQAQEHLHQIKNLNEDVESLQEQLQGAQQGMKGLEENLAQLAIKYTDAQRAKCDAEEERHKQIAHGDLLKQEMAILLTNVSKLEQDLASVQDDKKIMLSDRISQLEEKELEIKNLQEQVKDAESCRSSLTETLSEAKIQWSAEKEKLLEELTQLKVASLEGQKDLAVQLDSVERLKGELLHMQQENGLLKEHSSQVVRKHMDAERAIVEARDELNKQIESRDLLKLDMAAVLSNVQKLELDLARLQDEKRTLLGRLEAMQLDMVSVQGENEHLMSQLKAGILELEEKESEINNLQEDLKAGENCSLSLSEALSRMKSSWNAEQDRLQEELAQLKAANIEGQNALAIQLDCVNKLKDELSGLHGERFLLQEDRELVAKKLTNTQREAAEQLNQIEDARKREQEKDAKLVEFSALAETLKQSLSAKDVEYLSLADDLRRSAECHNAAEKRFTDEICFLQSEEMKWRNEVTANSALMADKIASLRMEIAALHEDLSLKIELGLKLQREVESLTEERRSLSQALEDMAAEMQDLRNEHYIVKEVVMPSLEERVVELQDETRELTISNDRHIAAIGSLTKQLEDATGELLRLHDKNALHKVELILNVEMLRHVDGVLATAKAEILQLFDKLGLHEKHSQSLEQMLTKASDENEDLCSRLLSVVEERDGLKTEVHYLLAMHVGVERLRRELVVAREDNCLVRGIESAGTGLNLLTGLPNTVGDAEEPVNVKMHNVQPIQNIRVGPEQVQESVNAHKHQPEPHELEQEMEGSLVSEGNQHLMLAYPLMQIPGFPPRTCTSTSMQMSLPLPSGPQDVVKNDSSDLGASKEGSDGKVEASVSSHAHVLCQLEEEIHFLQEKIQRLEVATLGQGSAFASNEIDARDVSSVAHEDLPSPRKESTASSSSIITVEEAVPGRLDEVLRLKEENQNLVEENDALKSQSLAAWMDEVLRLKEENQNLVEENDALKSQSLAAWMENNLIENSVRDLQAKLALLQEKNEHLNSEVGTCKADIDRLDAECHSLQEKNTALQQDLEASIQDERKSKETVLMLEDVITSLERQIRRLQAENEFGNGELKKLRGTLSGLHDVGTELIALLKMKMVTTLEEVKLMIEECSKEMGEEGIVQLVMNIEHVCLSRHEDVSVSLPEDKQGVAIESAEERLVQDTIENANERPVQETMSELAAKNMLILSELQMRTDEANLSRHVDVSVSLPEDKPGLATESADEKIVQDTIENADERQVQETMLELAAKNVLILSELQTRTDEANMLLEVVVFMRKMMIRYFSDEHTCHKDALIGTVDNALNREEAFEAPERTTPSVNDVDLDLVGSVEHHIKLAERLHQAFMDERLEQELLDLKEGRKQLKEELAVRLDEVQRTESELEKLQQLLQEGERVEREDQKKKKKKDKKAEESMRELRDMLAQQRWQIGRMQEEVMFGEEQQEAAAENQVTVLVSMESAPSMEGWDDEQVNLLSRELEGLRTLNRRHSTELLTISQDLQSMGSIIKAAQDQLLLGSPEYGGDEIVAMADLRSQKSSIVDLRTQNSRVSVDSIQQLLSPSPHIGVEGASVAAHRSSSDGGAIGQFHLRPRNFGFTWFLLLFSPDRKAASLARSRSNKRWAALKPMRRSSSGSTGLVVERGRRKAAGCWACISNTSRLDSFDHR